MAEFKTHLELSTGDEVEIIVTYDYFKSETVYHESMKIEDVRLAKTGNSIEVRPDTLYALESEAYEHLKFLADKKQAQLEDYHEAKREDAR